MPYRYQMIDCSIHRARLLALAKGLPEQPRRDLPGYFGAAREAAVALPARLLDTLDAFRAGGNPQGFLYLRNLPVAEAEVPPTPREAHEDDLDPERESRLEARPRVRDRALLDMEAWIALIAIRLGVPVGYAGNRGGAVMQDVYPVPHAQPLTAHNTLLPLTFHTEMAYHTHQPHYLVMGCLRSDHSRTAKTFVASNEGVLARLGAQDVRTLRSRPVPFHVDLRFRKGGDPTTALHVLREREEGDELRYDQDLILEREAGDVAPSLRALALAADESAAALTLCPGDVLIIDNFRTAHARSAFAPAFDGADRWLCRLFVRDPARSSRAPRPAEVLPFALRPAEQPA
jgi:clavaminate synthase/L-asparagine oxygenase